MRLATGEAVCIVSIISVVCTQHASCPGCPAYSAWHFRADASPCRVCSVQILKILGAHEGARAPLEPGAGSLSGGFQDGGMDRSLEAYE